MAAGKSSTLSPAALAAEVNSSKNVPWYLPTIQPAQMSSALVELLRDYAGIPPSEQEKHLFAVRDRAWEVFPMPCVGLWWWLVLGLSRHPHYPSLLTKLKSDPDSKFLDLGTCVGQDARKLLQDGVPLSSVYSSDHFSGYEDVGHFMFRDEKTYKGHFFTADLFDESSDAPLVKSRGTWDVVSVFMFLHAFDYEDQVLACREILKLLKPRRGSLVVGAQSASTSAGDEHLGEPFLKPGVVRKVYRHNIETFTLLWEKVAKLEGLKLKIWADYMSKQAMGEEDAELQPAGYQFWKGKVVDDHQKRLFFSIERLD